MTNLGYKGIANYYRIGISDVYKIFQMQKPEYVFIDVRSTSKLKKGIIPGAKTITLEQLEENINNFDKSLHYIMVCNYGERSGIAANILGKKGFPNIYNFQGGMLDWYYNNYPVLLVD